MNGTTELDHWLMRAERDLLGKRSDTYSVELLSRLAASIDSALYFSERMSGCFKCRTKEDNLVRAVSTCAVEGAVLEFGVHTGHTINHIASVVEQAVFGFDVFTMGLPEDWREGFPAGAFSSAQPPAVRENVELVVGLFQETLPTWVESHPGAIRFLHVDCDLYSSTKTIFRCAGHKIVKGTVLVFDEYFNYPGWRLHEFKAFQEFITWSGLKYEYLCAVTDHQQVAVVVTG